MVLIVFIAKKFCHISTNLNKYFVEHILKANVGGVDRILRIIIGLALIAWALTGGPVWAWVGVVPLATGIVKICPAYSILGFNTCKK
jgi:hypothetical protein